VVFPAKAEMVERGAGPGPPVEGATAWLLFLPNETPPLPPPFEGGVNAFSGFGAVDGLSRLLPLPNENPPPPFEVSALLLLLLL